MMVTNLNRRGSLRVLTVCTPVFHWKFDIK